MSWRTVQLGNALCSQDQLIIKLFNNRPVRYIGSDTVFAKNLQLDHKSSSVVAVFNSSGWLTDLLQFIEKSIRNSDEFYIGINRYHVIGNNTTHNFTDGSGKTLINFVSQYLNTLGYVVLDSGHMDHDEGKYFNFVQPLTWVYGTIADN